MILDASPISQHISRIFVEHSKNFTNMTEKNSNNMKNW